MESLSADATILDQAIAWSIALTSGTASDEQRAACQAWRSARSEHEEAWQQVQAVERAFDRIPTANEQLAYRVLQAPAKAARGGNRLRAAGVLGVLAVIAVAAPLALLMPLEQAEYRTGVGQHGSFTLSDGSALHLNTDSVAAMEYSLLRRRIVLQRGEILIDTGRDTGALFGRRSFRVVTDEAELEALGTRFNVRRSERETRLAVVEGRVAVHAGAVGDTVVHPGETIILAAGSVVPPSVQRIDPAFDATAWADGVLVAKQMRLDAFVAELSRYDTAPLHCDPGIAAMQVSGVFQLTGVDPVGHTLAALTRALPVRIARNPDGSTVLHNTTDGPEYKTTPRKIN